MDYKEYYKEIKDKLLKFSDVVYYEPMSDNEILDIEKQTGHTIKPLYREYLLAFGMTQDAFEKLTTSVESHLENFDFIKDSLNDYLPISSEVDEDETIFLINNSDLQDDFIYRVKVNDDQKIGKVRKLKLFHQLIEKSISDINASYKDRCPNKDKINNTEFIISGKDFPAFTDLFKAEGLKQKTKWRPKYFPENIFRDEVAIFELFNNEITIEREDDYSQYRFELDEPILIDKEKSITLKIEHLLNAKGIKFEKNECKLIETE